MHSLEEAAALAEAFVSTPFSGDPRHQRRIDMVTDYERSGTPSTPATGGDMGQDDSSCASTSAPTTPASSSRPT